MATKTFSVIPVDGGWAVQAAIGEQLMFLSGGRAEAKANQLAELARRMGDTARVLVHDRNGRLIGQRLYPIGDGGERGARGRPGARAALNSSR